jgi:hypothetical protein
MFVCMFVCVHGCIVRVPWGYLRCWETWLICAVLSVCDAFKSFWALWAGVVTTVVGTGSAGFTDGPPLTSSLFAPSALALTSDERSLYICDSGNNAIRTWSMDAGVGFWLLALSQRRFVHLVSGHHAPTPRPHTPPSLLPYVVYSYMYLALSWVGGQLSPLWLGICQPSRSCGGHMSAVFPPSLFLILFFVFIVWWERWEVTNQNHSALAPTRVPTCN